MQAPGAPRACDICSILWGAVHGFTNSIEVQATALAIIAPGLLSADCFREVVAVVEVAAVGPRYLAAIGQVMRRQGLALAI